MALNGCACDEELPMPRAILKAQNTIVIAARLYGELARSATDLLRPSSYAARD